MQAEVAVTLDYQQSFITRDVDVSLPGRDEILAKIAVTGVCHVGAVMRDNPETVFMPAIFGHEDVGVIANVGGTVSGIRVGDHVVFSYTACHYCENYLSDHPSAYEELSTLNFGDRREDDIIPYRLGDRDPSLFSGQSSFSQYVVTRASNAAVIDPEVDLTLLGPPGCGTQTDSGTVFNHLKLVTEKSTTVFDYDAVGLSAIMTVKLTGCSQIIVVGIYASHLALADELGTTHQINGKEQDAVTLIKQITGKGAHYAVEATGVSAIVLQAVHVTKSLGMVVIVGLTGDITSNAQNDLMVEDKPLVGVIEGDAIPVLFIPLLVQQYKQGKFPIDRFTIRYLLANINQAFVDSASGKMIKPVVVM